MTTTVDTPDGGDAFDETPIDEAAEQRHAEKHAQVPSRFRIVNFLRGSWRELQRVQWPDRQHVTQATAVVAGFVAIAGTYLGLADFLSAKFMQLIL
ncbi:MAG: preprotein translocase subunit SecE [Solirubrobacterales bacterium]|nr:preprotein translocase subunit SecE [Solirubrobacterales bacterium]